MKRYQVLWMLIISLLAGSCMGCGTTAETEEVQSVYVSAVSMESTPVINYIVPQIKPNILVNRIGYSHPGEKEAAVKGKELPKQFALLNAETGAEVFRGNIENIAYNEEMKIYTGKVSFTDYIGEGTFYLECDNIGRSLTFTIGEEMYNLMLSEVYQEMIQGCRDHTAAVSDVAALLTAYEWYPEVFVDADSDEIPDVMEEIAGWIQQREQMQSDENHETLYVATLAKFSYLHQKFDLQYATECLQHASAVFSKSQAPLGRDADNFYALTELYRATGLYTYRTQIQDYASYFEGNSSYLEETSYLYGAMTYLATRQKVDVDLCNTFMVDIRARGEEVSNRYEEMLSPVTAKNNGVEDLLAKATELLCCNYVLNNYEYTHIIEEFLHYLCGRNLESVCFYPEEGNSGRYLLLLSQLTATADRR